MNNMSSYWHVFLKKQQWTQLTEEINALRCYPDFLPLPLILNLAETIATGVELLSGVASNSPGSLSIQKHHRGRFLWTGEANVAAPWGAVGMQIQPIANWGNLGIPRRTQEKHVLKGALIGGPRNRVGMTLDTAKEQSPLMGPSPVDL